MLYLIYTHNAQGRAASEGECIYIKPSMSASVITNIYNFKHSEKLPKPEGNCSIVFIVWIVHFDFEF